jgi:hypothetical protein
MSGDKSHREHYTEQVVLFDGQAISFPYEESHPPQSSKLAQGDAKQSISAASCEKNKNNYFNIRLNKYDPMTGLPIITDGESMYLCFQNLFKIHPILDNVFMKILQLDRNGHIILQAARDLNKTAKVLSRIQQAVIQKVCYEHVSTRNNYNNTTIDRTSCDEAEQILSRIHFIPRVPSQTLKTIYSKVDVILHPFPFGGSKTASDAFKSGKPLITWPQPYLRGETIECITDKHSGSRTLIQLFQIPPVFISLING